MKTAISLPEKTFEKAEALAKKLGISRSELYVKALEQFLSQQIDTELTESFNKVYAEMDSSLDATLRAAAQKTLKGSEW